MSTMVTNSETRILLDGVAWSTFDDLSRIDNYLVEAVARAPENLNGFPAAEPAAPGQDDSAGSG